MALTDEEEATLRREFDDTKAALKRANDEAKGHRLTSDRVSKHLEELREAMERERAEALTARQKERDDLTGKLTSAEQAAAERDKASRDRVMRADLKVAAKEAGMTDLDLLKLVDVKALKLDDDGGVTNAADVLAEMKKAKAYAFAAVSTSSTSPTPGQKAAETPLRYGEMTADQQRAFRLANGQRR